MYSIVSPFEDLTNHCTLVHYDTPTGNTQFHAAKMNFESTSYDWLVISGASAQYKGTGTIDKAGNYGFLLTAIDGRMTGGGGIDKFRIKIRDKDNAGAIV